MSKGLDKYVYYLDLVTDILTWLQSILNVTSPWPPWHSYSSNKAKSQRLLSTLRGLLNFQGPKVK